METFEVDASAAFAALAIGIAIAAFLLLLCIRQYRLLCREIAAISKPSPPSPSQAIEVSWAPGDVFLLHCSGGFSDEGMERLKKDFDALMQNPTTRAIVLEQGMRVTVVHRPLGTGT